MAFNESSIIIKPIPNIDPEKKIEKVQGIILCFNATLFNKKAQYSGYEYIKEKNKETKNFGYHYGLDAYDTVQYVTETFQTIYVKESSPTYISNALSNGQPQSNMVNLALFINEEHDYEKTEKQLIEFLVYFLKKNNLTTDNVWRDFDIVKNSESLIPFYTKDTWEVLLKEVKDLMTDDKHIIISPFKGAAETEKISINDYVLNLIKKNKDNPDFFKTLQPYDKNLKEIKDKKADITNSELKTKNLPNDNVLQYKITQNSPNGDCQCVKAADNLSAIETLEDTMVEPIYPDLIATPGSNFHIADGFSSSEVKSEEDTPLSIEELEKRQKTFNIKDFSNVKKETKGKPINCADPFPIDDQIKKLEEHLPKVKIDKVIYEFDDDNHLGSIIGQAMAKNYTMCYDMVSEISQRVEKRLVKIENNLATTMRYLFRAASRMNINCVYYGGQDIFGKYKCIRCLHDDRLNDGASVTLDQCLTCTRYEPIIGQIYAILDEAGSNIVQVMDDMQMAYMNIDDFKQLTRIEEFNDKKLYANLKQENTPQKLFIEEKWLDKKEEEKKEEPKEEKNVLPEQQDTNKIQEEKKVPGFKMDWKDVKLETQKPNINTYDTEGIKGDKKAINSLEKIVPIQDFKDTRETAETYPELIFDIKDYIINDFGTGGSYGGNFGGLFGEGGTEIRNKIIAYAENALKLCQDGKAGYSQKNRYNHLDKAINGFSYWDCSSLVQGAYEAAGIANIGSNTLEQFPNCLKRVGGILIPITEEAKAIPGDIVFFSDQNPKPSTVDQLENANAGLVGHVGIYVGGGQYIHSSTDRYPQKEQIKKSPTKNYDSRIMCFGRPKSLVELDKKFLSINNIPIPDYSNVHVEEVKIKWLKKMSALCIAASTMPQNRALFPSVAIAQAITESGWGQFDICNNCFGVKADSSWKGPKTTVGTLEENAWGQKISIKDSFRIYKSPEESVLDRYKFLIENSRYKQNGVFSASNSEAQCEALQRAGYATDSNYASYLIGVIHDYKLNRCDDIAKQLVSSKE